MIGLLGVGLGKSEVLFAVTSVSEAEKHGSPADAREEIKAAAASGRLPRGGGLPLCILPFPL